MKFEQLQKNWDQFGKIDPLWAILTNEEKRNNKWDVEEFFRTGKTEIDGVMEYINFLHHPLRRQKALDFGCGVGRLTQALCRYFDQCYGIDIAPSMIELAEKYNSYGSKCRYYTNPAQNLSLFEDNSFDFIYSNMVLQHMEPEYSKNYIKEFIRVLAGDGLLIFQIPSERVPVKNRLLSGQSTINHPLPKSAFQAKITVLEPLTQVKAGSLISVLVNVKNASDTTWPALGDSDDNYQIRLGNHWLSQEGDLLINDDGRASLAQNLKPMEEVNVDLNVTAPVEPGKYILELDMVQEMVSWFKDKGSLTVKVPVQVEESNGAKRPPLWGDHTMIAPDVDLTVPRMEMYEVSKDVVLELIASSGGEIVDVKQDTSPGPSWLSFTYCVRKKLSA